jgi:hypothetical protein
MKKAKCDFVDGLGFLDLMVDEKGALLPPVVSLFCR